MDEPTLEAVLAQQSLLSEWIRKYGRSKAQLMWDTGLSAQEIDELGELTENSTEG